MIDKKVSIIIPVYNAEKTIDRCVESILNQTYTNLQVILINDGSKDESLKHCYKYQIQDERVEVYSHKNRGVSYTRNCGIKHVTGEFIMFVDSDDYVKNTMVETYISALERNHADIVIGGISFIKSDETGFDKMPNIEGIMDSKSLWEALCTLDNSIWGYVPNKLYRASLIIDNNICFNEKMTAQEDFAFALEVFSKARSFCVIKYSGYYYECNFVSRNVPAQFLIGNQQKILRYAMRAGVACDRYKTIIKKIQIQTYTCLYHSKTKDDIVTIMDIPDIIEHVKPIKYLNGEARIILHWFIARKVNLIWGYFCIRKKIRQLLKGIE